MVRYPNLFVVGVSKCGTTYFHELLQQHYDVCSSAVKETFFLQRPEAMNELEQYYQYFNCCTNQRIVFEATPIYSETTTFPHLPERLWCVGELPRILMLVRSPLDRLRSIWRQTLSSGHQYRSKYYDMKMPQNVREAIMRYPIFLEATKYWTHLQNYRKVFPSEHIKVIFFEDLVSQTSSVMRDVCEFLDIDPDFEFDFDGARRNESAGKTEYQPIVQALMCNPVVRWIHKLVPLAGAYRWLRKRARPVPGEIRIDQATRERIRGILQPEVDALLADQGKPKDFWVL